MTVAVTVDAIASCFDDEMAMDDVDVDVVDEDSSPSDDSSSDEDSSEEMGLGSIPSCSSSLSDSSGGCFFFLVVATRTGA